MDEGTAEFHTLSVESFFFVRNFKICSKIFSLLTVLIYFSLFNGGGEQNLVMREAFKEIAES